MTPEGKVKEACKKFLKERDAFFFMPVSNGMGQVGIPDIIICYGKRANVTDNQKRIMENIRDAGGFAWVVDDPSDMGALFTALDAYKKLNS
jgi:hypothetical protein